MTDKLFDWLMEPSQQPPATPTSPVRINPRSKMRAIGMSMAMATLAVGCAPTMDELSATCVEYGFKPQTTEFLECRQREKNAWDANMNALNNALWM